MGLQASLGKRSQFCFNENPINIWPEVPVCAVKHQLPQQGAPAPDFIVDHHELFKS